MKARPIENTFMTRRMSQTTLLAFTALLVISSAMLLLRVENLSSPLYYDEAVYVNLAQHPFHSDFYDDPIFFRHPPAHYLLLAVVGKSAGFSEVAMRLPSLLFAGGTALLIYLIGLQLFSRTVGFIAAVLLTCNVLQQQYAESATMYAMFAFAVTLCAYGFARQKEWLIAIGFLLAIYTHYFGFYLAPALLLFYHQKFEGDLKQIARRIGYYVLAYIPWLVIAAQGLAFHANRTSGLRWWDWHTVHACRQMSLLLLVAAVCFMLKYRRQRELQPLLLICASYMLTAFFLIPFHRYLVPFLPLLILFGVAALAELVQRFAINGKIRFALSLLCAGALVFPNPQAYGFFPQHGKFLDARDSIHAQEWDKVVARIPDHARIATPNARSLLFYSNLKGLRQYEVTQFNENAKEFEGLLEQAAHEWILVTKYPLYVAHCAALAQTSQYARVAEFEHTILYQKRPLP